MAKGNITINEMEAVENLIELLEKHYNELPKELQESLEIAEQYGFGDYDADKFQMEHGYGVEVETSFHTNKILSVNRFLKRVEYTDDNLNVLKEYPEHFFLKANGKLVMEW